MDTIRAIEDRRAELQAEMERLDKQQRELEAMRPEAKFAIALHSCLCRWNHTDGCGWHYEIRDGVHDWNAHAHSTYLAKAIRLKQHVEGRMTEDEVLDFIKLINS